MTLKEILAGKNHILVREYEPFEGRTLFIGSTYYVDGQLVSLDGRTYTLALIPSAYEWDSDGNLMIMR